MALKNISNNLQFDFGVSEYHSNIVATNNYIAPQYGIGQQQTTTTTSSSSSSSQIRTSSPISSPSSEPTNLEELLANRHRVLPRFALRAVRSSQSLKRNTNKMAMPPPEMAKYPSMRELAYKKLREANALREMLEQHQIKSKGRLKLAVYANTATHLTVHIVEAMAKTGVSKSETVAAYVKITQIPEDVDRRLVVKTRIIEPVDGKYHFNDKFSFEICQLNPNNRLIFALWTIDASSQDHLVGCFSFRIRNLLSSAFSRSSEASSSRRTASYWYHLLPFDLGVQRHIKCSSHHSSSSNHAQNHHQPKAPNVNSDLQGMEHVTLVLRRPDSSIDSNNEVTYGFTLSNSCPCQVSKVGLNSIAHRSGLRCGDFISRVNKVNVSRASCESVAKMIKQSRGDLVLEVYREPQNDQDDIEDNYNYYQVFCHNIPPSKPINTQENKDDVLMVVDEEESDEPPFARMYASLKYVDSMTTSSSNNDDGDLLDDDYEAADKLRRAAANYVYLPLKNSSSNCNQHPPQVNNPCLDYNHLNRYHLHK